MTKSQSYISEGGGSGPVNYCGDRCISVDYHLVCLVDISPQFNLMKIR